MTLFWECPNRRHVELLCQMQPLGLRTDPAAVFKLCALKEMPVMWMQRGRVKENSRVSQSIVVLSRMLQGGAVLCSSHIYILLCKWNLSFSSRYPVMVRSCLGYFEGDLKGEGGPCKWLGVLCVYSAVKQVNLIACSTAEKQPQKKVCQQGKEESF